MPFLQVTRVVCHNVANLAGDTCHKVVNLAGNPCHKVVNLAGDTSDVRVVELPIIDSLQPRPPYVPQMIPTDIADKLIHFHGAPFVWWVGQFFKYLLRPQPALSDDIRKLTKSLGFRNPIVG